MYILWRNNYNSSAFSWTLAEEETKNTSCANATIVTNGTHTADNSLGHQWYKYTNTSSTSKAITISSCNFTSANTYIQIYENCSSSSVAYNSNFCSSQSQVTYNVDPDETIYIKWLNSYTSSTYSWSLTEAEPLNTTCSYAEEITKGTQTANNAEGDQWYKYTNTTSSPQELNFSSCNLTTANTYLKLYHDCSSSYFNYDYSSCSSQSDLDYTIAANETIYILWDDYYTTSSYSWEFSIIGDNECSDATPISLGSQTSSNSNGLPFYSYTNMTSSVQDITISSCNLTSFNTSLNVFSSCSAGKTSIASNDDYCGYQSLLVQTVAPNETIYIEWSDSFFRGQFDWVITTDDVLADITYKAENNNISIYPNPITDIFTIESDYSISKIEIYTMEGRLLKKFNLQDLTHQLNIADLKTGIYTLKIHTSDGFIVNNIVKK